MQLILDFLNDLIANNSKDWMDANRSYYQMARSAWIEKVAEILRQLATHDQALAGLKPRNTIFRINNNRKFHPDKPVYKHHFAFSPSMKEVPAFYLHVSPEGSFVAGGLHRPDTTQLKKVREAIDYDGEELKQIIHRPSFRSFFGGLSADEQQLKTSPRGYSESHPHIDLLRRRNFTALKTLTPKEVTGPQFINLVEAAYLELMPLNNYLKEAIQFEP